MELCTAPVVHLEHLKNHLFYEAAVKQMDNTSFVISIYLLYIARTCLCQF